MIIITAVGMGLGVIRLVAVDLLERHWEAGLASFTRRRTRHRGRLHVKTVYMKKIHSAGAPIVNQLSLGGKSEGGRAGQRRN